MTLVRSTCLSIAALILTASSGGAGAEQSPTVAVQPQTGPAMTTAGGQVGRQGTTGQRSAQNRVSPQGFSVVLVVGDLQSAGGEEDVPPAARKALVDMKEFLPYKSYRLLDAAWVLCCGTANTSTVTRLRGPEEREYEVEISTHPSNTAKFSSGLTRATTDESGTYVQFMLREVSITDEPAASLAAGTRREEQTYEQLRQQLHKLETDYSREQRNAGNSGRIRELERELESLRLRLAESTPAGRGRKSTAAKKPSRSIINTSFTMDLGETVVVGTSRLKGNRQALIALLTAVPARSLRR
jgi:hypothetical protein